MTRPLDPTDAAAMAAEAERRRRCQALGVPFTADPDAVAAERREVRALAEKGARRGQKAARKPRTGAARTSAPPKMQSADKRVPSEHEEQAELVARCDTWAKAYPELGMLFAVPNGGFRSKRTAVQMQREGLKPGVPDLVLPVSRPRAGEQGYRDCGLFVEMKRRNAPPSAVSPLQCDWHERLTRQGYRVVVCRGADEAWAAICEYLNITPLEDAA